MYLSCPFKLYNQDDAATQGLLVMLCSINRNYLLSTHLPYCMDLVLMKDELLETKCSTPSFRSGCNSAHPTHDSTFMEGATSHIRFGYCQFRKDYEQKLNFSISSFEIWLDTINNRMIISLSSYDVKWNQKIQKFKTSRKNLPAITIYVVILTMVDSPL